MANAVGVDRRRILTCACVLIAVAAAVVFLSIAVDRQIYAPGAHAVFRHVARLDDGNSRFFRSRALFETIGLALRKTYSVGAFAVLGFFLSPLFAREQRLRSAGLFVFGFSTLIEFMQKLAGLPESLGSNAFDMACGFVGGWLGAAAWNALVDRRADSSAAKKP
ncbi:MAG: hypothetical protein IAI49_04365 [Candidatus Eremiobacteraeota bacterium]|nr:hypothetical protein [Candidatus Eremiobacteraeota bacterium]